MKKPRILVVEDDDSTRKSLRLILKEKGYLVDLAKSGSDAIEIARGVSFNLAIVDIRLPDMNGTALLASFKKLHPQISIIMVTGYASLETAIQALNDGAEAYIIKPINVDLVLATISRVLEIQYLAEEKIQAEAALRESEKRLKVLHEMDYAILALQSSRDIARAGLEHLHQLVRFDIGFVVLIEENSERGTVLATFPDGCALSEEESIIKFEPNWIISLKSGEVLFLDHFETWNDNSKNVEFNQLEKIKSIIAVPLIAQDDLLGTLNLGCKEGLSISKANIQIAMEVARPMSIAIKQANLMDQVLSGRERLKRLSKQLLEVQESERRAIALELHDQIGQTLTAVKINLQSTRRLDEITLIKDNLDNCIDSVDQTLQEVRSLALNLRPSMLDDLGLDAALRWLVDRQAQSAGLSVDFYFETGNKRATSEIETACYRVAQEAITNVIRHAQATQIGLSLIQDDQSLTLAIRDNGIGFDVPFVLDTVASGKSLGLLGMFERTELVGGSLKINSKLGKGTTYLAKFPMITTEKLERRNLRRRNG